MIVLPFQPTNIHGWTYSGELSFLYNESLRLADQGIPGALLEVGCWLGRSTYPLACTDHVDVIDTFAGSPEIPEADRVPDQLATFCENMTVLGVGDRITCYKGESWYWLERLTGPYRLIFVDGGHDYPTVSNDLTQAKRLLSPGGTLVVDDVCVQFPGVQRAVRDVLANDVTEVGKMGVHRCPREASTGSPPKRTAKLAT